MLQKKMPEQLEKRTNAICQRFTISGICDPMYIANVIAHTNGFGDGCGLFTDCNFSNPEKAAKALQGAYCSNISETELDELTEIIRTGKMNQNKAIRGIIAFIGRCRKEEKECEEWRVEYLKYVVDTALTNLKEIGGNYL